MLFLDEPTIGLDVISQKTVREFLRRHNAAQKTTILLTSHYMADIQELCERVIIIDHGKIFFDGKLERNRGPLCRFQARHHPMRSKANEFRRKIWRATAKWWKKPPAAIKLKVKRDRVIPVCKALLDELPVSDIDIQEVPIEDVIRQIFAR